MLGEQQVCEEEEAVWPQAPEALLSPVPREPPEAATPPALARVPCSSAPQGGSQRVPLPGVTGMMNTLPGGARSSIRFVPPSE